MRTIIIGRNPNSDVVVNDSKVADSHLQIMQDDLGNFYIKDLGSETGTFVNNEQITDETPLNPTDVVRVGKVTIPWRNYFAAAMPAATTINVINQPVRKVVIDTRASAAWGVLSFILSFFSWLFFPAVLSVTFGLIAIFKKSKAKGLGIAGIIISVIILLLWLTWFSSMMSLNY